MRTMRRGRLWTFLASAAVFLLPAFASGQARDEYGGEIHQTVARISYIDGSASFARGDDPDNWQAADRNVPMTIGDRVYTGNRGRLELQIHGGSFVRLGTQTDLTALNLTDDTKQFSVQGGVASFQVRRLSQNEIFEIDTPNAAITIDRPGEFRVDVDRDGNTRIAVRSGQATVAAGGGQVPLRSGDEMDIDGIDSPRYDIVGLARPDGWDGWVQTREQRTAKSRSYEYVSADIVGVDDLDEYGRWDDIPQYGRVWSPASVASDWAPYRAGHWIWQDPWGWTWISSEDWGWAPYHYGRWVNSSSRWYWVPGAGRTTAVVYSPALVAFVGGGPGWSSSASFGGGGGFVGWFPLGPRDPLVPWWSRRSNVNVGNVTYVNRNYVTVVNQNTFVSGGLVGSAFVRDRAVVQQVVAAPVLRGPLPFMPTQASLRVAARSGLPAAARPPAQVIDRAVVARVAPPAASPTFQQKVTAIRQNRGAPVAPAEAAQIAVGDRGHAQATTVVRPALPRDGQMTLAPRGRAAVNGAAPRAPQPLTESTSRGRPLATSQQPVGPGPVTSGTTSVPSRGQGSVAQPPASREIVPRQEQAPIERARPSNERVAPPAQVPVPQREVQQAPTPEPQRGRQQQNPQAESWRSRPTAVAPRSVPTPQAQPQPQPVESRERVRGAQPAPPPTAAPQNERAVQPQTRGRENVAPPQERQQPAREARPAPPAQQQPAPPAAQGQQAQPPDRSRQGSDQKKEEPKKDDKKKEEPK
jgi:hypothetical protein